MAEGAVHLGVGGGVGGGVLGTEFVLDLGEGFLQFLPVIAHVDDAAAGFFGQLLGRREPAVTPAAVEAAVGDQDYIDQGIGLLRGGYGFADFRAAALVLGVGQDDQGFAPGFLGQLFVR